MLKIDLDNLNFRFYVRRLCLFNKDFQTTQNPISGIENFQRKPDALFSFAELFVERYNRLEQSS